ncbi:uncharacterized protein LOC144102568 [Amblyomma americanum]
MATRSIRPSSTHTRRLRGRQKASEQESTYQVVLPGLPTGRYVLNTVFLHVDITARPYRVEDFRDALAQHSSLPDIIALGAYCMSHVWAVTFKEPEGVKKIAGIGELSVKEQRCLVIDLANQDVRLKLHWLLYNVPDEDVRVAFASYGKVSEVARECWRVHGVLEKGSTTRLITLKLKAGVNLDDLPYQLNVGGELVLVGVPGRPPLCLRCRGTGHIRKECRVPRCGACRRFGHEDGQCARTYASIAGPGNSEDSTELLMDEAGAEEAARATGQVLAQKAPALTPLSKKSATTTVLLSRGKMQVLNPIKKVMKRRKTRRKPLSNLRRLWRPTTPMPWTSARKLLVYQLGNAPMRRASARSRSLVWVVMSRRLKQRGLDVRR